MQDFSAPALAESHQKVHINDRAKGIDPCKFDRVGLGTGVHGAVKEGGLSLRAGRYYFVPLFHATDTALAGSLTTACGPCRRPGFVLQKTKEASQVHNA